MAKDDGRTQMARCSFCGKSESMVNKLIEGPDVYICDECIGLCNELIREKKIPCLFCDNKKASEIYEKVGFEKIGYWSIYRK